MIHAAQSVLIRTDDPTKIVPKIQFTLLRGPDEDEEDRRSVYLYSVGLEDDE